MRIIKSVFIFILTVLTTNIYAGELQKVTLQLSWFNQFQFAGYYIAKEKGFYEDVGLDVTIKNFDFGINVVDEVVKNKVDYGIGRETLLLEQSKIVALYALFQASPLVLLSTKDSNINSVNDFKDKRIMTTIDDAGEVSLKAMISSHNIDIKNLNFIKHTHNILDLVNNKTDVISAYISKTPYDLTKLGVDYNVFYPKDYGFDMYSDFLFTNMEKIKYSEEEVIKFRNASLKGWEYAFNNIEESALLILQKYNNQNISKDALVYEGEELKKLAYFEHTKIGEIQKSKLQRIIDLYKVMGLTQHTISADTFMYKNHYNLFTETENRYLKNLEVLNVCINPKDLEYNGILTDYLELIKEKIDLKYQYIDAYNLNQAFIYLKENRCNVVASVENSQKLPNNIYLSKSYVDIPLVIATKKDVTFISDIKYLKNQKIGVIKNAIFMNSIKNKYPNANLIEVKSVQDGLKKVKKEELFAFIGTITNISKEIEDNYITNLKISGKIDEKLSLSLATLSEKPIMANILDKLLRLVSKHERQKIINKWILIEYEKNFDYSFIVKIVFVVVLIFFALLYRQLLLNKLNKTLKIKVKYKTKQLQRLNKDLEEKIKKEVENSRKKDKLLSQQIKMVAMGEMLENVAHQWRQPLSVISTTATGIKMQKENKILTDKFLLESMDSINETSQYLSKTLEDFRRYYKPNKEIIEFDIKDVYNKSFKIIDSKYKSLNIKIIEDIKNVTLFGLDSELMQSIMNIINNAKDVLENRKLDKKYIFIDIFKRNEFLIILIRDNAGGIDSKIINRVFEPYFTTKHKSQGTGVGLYMCKEIIEKHMYGEISVENLEYSYRGMDLKGAQFKIKIPLNIKTKKNALHER